MLCVLLCVLLLSHPHLDPRPRPGPGPCPCPAQAPAPALAHAPAEAAVTAVAAGVAVDGQKAPNGTTKMPQHSFLPLGVESTIYTVNRTLVTVQATYLLPAAAAAGGSGAAPAAAYSSAMFDEGKFTGDVRNLA